MRKAKLVATARSRRLRRDATDAENKLWQKLRARQLNGVKFVRQEPVGAYIVDMICREHRLIVEVDGSQHAESARDAVRDKRLQDRNYRILRFWNNDVLANLSGVLQTIASLLEGTPPHPDRAADA